MKSRFTGAVAIALTSLGIFAGTAGAFPSEVGFYNSGHSVNSFQSPSGGTCNASNTPAGYVSNSAPVEFYPHITNCGYVG